MKDKALRTKPQMGPAIQSEHLECPGTSHNSDLAKSISLDHSCTNRGLVFRPDDSAIVAVVRFWEKNMLPLYFMQVAKQTRNVYIYIRIYKYIYITT